MGKYQLPLPLRGNVLKLIMYFLWKMWKVTEHSGPWWLLSLQNVFSPADLCGRVWPPRNVLLIGSKFLQANSPNLSNNRLLPKVSWKMCLKENILKKRTFQMMNNDKIMQKYLPYIPFVRLPLSRRSSFGSRLWPLLFSFWVLSASVWAFNCYNTASEGVLLTGPLCSILIATVLVMVSTICCRDSCNSLNLSPLQSVFYTVTIDTFLELWLDHFTLFLKTVNNPQCLS